MSIKNDGHYFCRAGGNRPDGLNEPVTNKPDLPDGKTEQAVREISGQERDRTATSEREAALPESVLRESQREREAVREVARENLLQERLQQMERDMVRDLQKVKTLGGD